MHALKTPSFFKPASRPSSPLPSTPPLRPDEVVGDRASRPLTKLSLTHFKKPSPAPSAAVTQQQPLVHDGSYLEALSLKLSEAVSKAIAQPVVATTATDSINGKGPIPAGRGRALGEVIVAELQGSKGNIHLQRAILRLLQRPLSVLLTNLSTLLLPLLSSPAFLTPPAPTVMQPNPNATQLHALSIATFCNELLDCFDSIDVELVNEHRGDSVANFKDGLVSIINRVANPLMGGVKTDLLNLIQGLEQVNPASLSTIMVKTLSGSKGPTNVHPSIASLQALIPLYSKALTRYGTFKCCQSTLATLLISVIWRALVALSHRPSSPRSRSNSVSAASAASTLKKRLGGSTTPPCTTPPASRFTMKLPGSRPPSPAYTPIPSPASDSRVLYDLLGMLPKPVSTNENNRVAREAVDEAFDALAALTALLGALDDASQPPSGEDFDLELLTDGLPVVIALPILLRWSGHGEPQVITAMLAISEVDYRQGCLSGFGRADECGGMVAQRILEVVNNMEDTEDEKTKIVMSYLEASVGAH